MEVFEIVLDDVRYEFGQEKLGGAFGIALIVLLFLLITGASDSTSLSNCHQFRHFLSLEALNFIDKQLRLTDLEKIADLFNDFTPMNISRV